MKHRRESLNTKEFDLESWNWMQLGKVGLKMMRCSGASVWECKCTSLSHGHRRRA